jgi:hypothetical protein
LTQFILVAALPCLGSSYFATTSVADPSSSVKRREQLFGMLNYYYREAA